MINKILSQNKKSWNAIADDWFGTTALPVYGCSVPTEDELRLFGDLVGKKVLDIGCGSGHSLKWCGEQGASELFGLDLSENQLVNADKVLTESGYTHTLYNQPMEDSNGITQNHFDIVYSIYAIGWTTDLLQTFKNVSSYLNSGGIFIFSWDHPFMHCVNVEDERVIFSGNYLDEDVFSFCKGGYPVTLYNRKLSTYINALATAGFIVEKVIEETDLKTLDSDDVFSSGYYSAVKAKRFPLSVIIKARKIIKPKAFLNL